jgi:hypothetical protein
MSVRRRWRVTSWRTRAQVAAARQADGDATPRMQAFPDTKG